LPYNQSDLDVIKNKAINCLQRHELQEAARLVESVCLKSSGDTDAWEMLASVYNQLGDIDKVVHACRQLASLQPQSARTQFNLAFGLHETGQLNDAIGCYQKVLDLEPTHVEAQYNLGVAFQEQGNPGAAISHYRKVLGIRPHWQKAQNNLALALRETGDLQGAIAILQHAIEANPSSIKLHHALGETYEDDDQIEKSIRLYQKALGMDQKNATSYLHLGGALLSLGDFDTALSQYQIALQKLPGNPDILLGLVDVYDAMGEYEQACKYLQPLLDKRPERVDIALRFSILCKHMHRCSEATAMLQRLIKQDNLQTPDARRSHFSLGRLFDAAEDYNQAFKHFQLANNLSHFSYDIQRFSELTKLLTATYSAENIAKLPRIKTGQDYPEPVFIVGMPRSGTSLLEQIISTHTNAFGAGELNVIPLLVANMGSELLSNYPYPLCLNELTEGILCEFNKRYMDYIGKLYAGSPQVVTDKMPENYLHLGLIELLFPQAKVIHCVRDPMDTCFSCYTQEFSGTHHYAYDLTNLGAYYYQYQRIMAHWSQVLMLPILEVRYEDMVTDTESTCHEIFDFLGLDWEEQCLLFYESGRFVKTVSQKQVKQPIYTESIGRWKHYQAYLGPLESALKKGM